MTTRGRQALFLRLATPLGLLLSATSGWALSSPPPRTSPLFPLAAKGRPLWPVIIPTNASPRIRAAASNLVHYLSRITGQPFAFEEGSQGPGIRVGLFASFSDRSVLPPVEATPFTRETYLLRSTSEGLLLLGATDLAVEHAVWDLLDRLGYRQFFPGPVWEVVPRVPDLAIAVDTLQTPAFLARRIWYNWGLWGYNRQPYAEWCARNRMAKGFDLNSGHSYETIVATFRSEFDAHPDYFALVGGERKRGSDAKFCVSHPGLQDLIRRYAIKRFTENPALDSISLDPSDGGGWCECEACAALGSPSDRALLLANIAAEAANALGLDPKFIGMYAYNRHATPPALRVHPNVIISATTAFITGGYTLDQILEGWQAKGATLGIYDYYSVVDWDWNLPKRARAANPFLLASNLVHYYQKGARFIDCESGDAWGPYGLGYAIAARVMWDLNEAERVQFWIDDFLAKAFGPAEEPMRRFYALMTVDNTRRSPRDQVGRMYRALKEALEQCGDQADIRGRIDHLILYTHYVELFHAYQNAVGSAKEAARDQVLAYVYRIRRTMMVHAYGLWTRLASQKAAHDPNHPLKTDTPISDEEILQFLQRGIEANPTEEMAFPPLTFSEELVPATPLRLPAVPAGSFPTVPQDRHTYFLWVDQVPADLVLTVTVQTVWALRPHHIRLYSPQEVTLDPVDENREAQPDGHPRTVILHTPYSGLHRLEVTDGGDYTRIVFPDGMPVVIPAGLDTPSVGSQFRGPWTLYFYVPKGTSLVGGWAQRVAAWAPRISGVLKDADDNVRLDFATREDGWFAVPVPPGQDGRLWKFEHTQGIRQLATVPPCFSRTAAELLLPREVVARDAQPPSSTP